MSWEANGWPARGAFAFALTLLLLGVSVSVADRGKSDAAAPTGFDHDAHMERLAKPAPKGLGKATCASCHGNAEAAKPPPTTRSHAPCLNSNCHVKEFLSTGPKAKAKSPEAYKQAVAFCSLCHSTPKGEAPNRFSKAKADRMYASDTGSEFHVEMNHFAHTSRAKCSSCHVVDAASFALVSTAPAHNECRGCHDEESKVPMATCDGCHKSPGADQAFAKTRRKSDVRCCESLPPDAKQPCFKHERTEHRFAKDSSPLECSSCHYMFKKKSHGGKSYVTIADIKAAPVMDNARDLAHKACGVGGCHRKEINSEMGNSRCDLCHSAKFMASGLFD